MDSVDRAYLKDMAAALRWRRIEEVRVVEVLRELTATASTSGRPLEETHGVAAKAAEKHERGKAWPTGLIVSNVLYVLVLGACIGYNTHRILGGSGPNLLVALASLLVTVFLLVLCTGVGHTIDSRLPEEVSR